MTTISKEMLDEMFERMRTEYRWNVDQPLLWGFFFTNEEAEPLEAAAAELEQQGYRVVSIELGEGDNSVVWLHVERVETHTVDSLDKRNHEFVALAARLNLASYDGMDVSPAPAEVRQ